MWQQQPERSVGHAEPSAAQERKETGRLEALSDGVFAIAMTLLVLSIPLPKGGATAQQTLTQLELPLITYVISFLTILVMWVNHHYMFQFVARIDRFFVIANGLLLMVIVFVNYPTALVADSIQASGAQFAAITYNVTLIIASSLYNALWFRIVGRRRLLVSDADDAEVASYTRQYILGGPMYIVALGLAFVSPILSIALDAALAIFWAFTGKIIRTQRHWPEQHHPAND
ncbi:MAG TPA: TMEM175 family protein [Ktedonobacterales bacterium]|nr:TMEM175 family protein [Ktedonobacterales bacterium]